MAAISTRVPAVTIEYDCRGVRKRKRFEDGYKARPFWIKKDKEGKNPKVIKEDA